MKQPPRWLRILKMALERATLDAVAMFPFEGEHYDMVKWAESLKLLVYEVVARKDMCNQAKFKSRPDQEISEEMLRRAEEEVSIFLEKKERRQKADAFLNLETLGPPPVFPQETHEKPEPRETQESHSEEQ